MSQQKTQGRSKQAMPGDKRRTLISVGLLLGLLVTGGAFARWAGSASLGLDKSGGFAPASLTPSSPSKEYIYAGGRLIATEEPASGACSYVIAPTNQSFAASGGIGSVTVTVAAGCGWTATSNDAWITVTSGASGSGNGSVGYSVGTNAGGARNGTMIIAGQTFTVNQAAAAGCSYSISPSSQSFAASGGSGSISVTAAAGCGWTAVSNDAWITINSGTPGSGNGSVGYSVGANAGGARSGSMTVAGQTFTVNQDAAGGGGTAPTLTNMSPATAIQGASFTLTINGSNLAGATSVNFSPAGDVTISNTNSTAGQVTCSVSIGAAAATGGRQVTVTTASGGTSTNFLVFGINSSSPAPTISTISPAKKARGTTFTLTIAGTNLSQTTSVNFNPSADITISNIVANSSQVTATVSISASAALGIRQVSVTTPAGTSNTKSFTVQ